MIARLTLRYLAAFAIVLLLLGAGAYIFVGSEYAALLSPAAGTPEATAAYAAAMRSVLLILLAIALPVLCAFGVLAWWLAQTSLTPLLQAQERERIFAADAAHALRSPLATIAAIAQARAQSSDGDAARAFNDIARAALDASDTVGELLTLARSASGNLLQREPVDVGAIASDVAREFRERASVRGVAIECEARSIIANADERRLREALRNLLDNALRYAQSTVRVKVSSCKPYVACSVWNDGETIAPDAKARLFQRFFRGDDGAAGSGLGLAIVQWIARAHDGEAFVRDGDRGGTEFVVRLPVMM